LAGLSACVKFSGLALVPVFLILEVLARDRDRSGSERLKAWGWGAAGSLLAVAVVYFPGTLLLPDHQIPWSYFWSGLQDLIAYSNYHHPTYFWGVASRENHWLYFPAAFLLKNTLPFLALLLFALGAALFQRQRFPFWLWVSPLVFFACVLPVQNLGIRYLLPLFPFLILMAAQTAGWFWQTPPRGLPGPSGRWLVACFLFWQIELSSFDRLL
jgi:hypothetical protein